MNRMGRRLCALGSLVTMVVALSPALDRLSDASFAWHMVQHMLLLMLAPVLALLAQPFFGFAALAGKRRTAAFLRTTHTLHAFASPPVGFGAFVAVLWVTHFSSLYQAALDNVALHMVEHGLYLMAGTLFWLPVISPKPLRPLNYPARLLYLMLALPQGALFSIALDASRRPLYPHYALHLSLAQALADQQAAAAVMWIVGGSLLFIAFLTVLGCWAHRETRGDRLVVFFFAVCTIFVPTLARAANIDGSALFAERCASCHGNVGQGSNTGPALVGLPASDLSFMLDTGRMPAVVPYADEIHRKPAFSPGKIRAIIAYILSLSPASDRSLPLVSGGDPVHGRTLFTENCEQCHGVAGDGGAIGANNVAPSLRYASTSQIAEAIRGGPGMMPRFSLRDLSREDVSDIARYVIVLQTETGMQGHIDAGGIGLSHVGAVAEGAIGWIFGLGILLLVSYALSRI